jgi:hypothetical protein
MEIKGNIFLRNELCGQLNFRVIEGTDIDADDDGLIDLAQTQGKGQFHATATQ